LSIARAAGEWTYEDDDRLSARPGVTYQYDANGSLIEQNDNGVITRYAYDIAGRLIEVRDGGDALIASYAYDPFGRRIQKITGGVTTYFLYSDEGLIAEADGSGTISRQYGWQPDGTWGTAPLYLSEGGKTYYYQNDHLGTPQKLITASGAVVWSAEFEAFGLAHVGVDAVENPLRFPGQYFDGETGRHYNFFRDYDPGIGRYVQSDPIGLDGGVNTFGYVGGDSLRFIDPYGLDFGFSVNSGQAGGNGHTTFYYQDSTGQWYSYDQGAAGEPTSGGNFGYFSNLPGGVNISPINAPPSSAVIYPTDKDTDADIAACASRSESEHASGERQYNLLSNNCTDAAVDVLSCSNIKVYNPIFTPRPNSWFDELVPHRPKICFQTRRGRRCTSL